jgi:hypothetical protein
VETFWDVIFDPARNPINSTLLFTWWMANRGLTWNPPSCLNQSVAILRRFLSFYDSHPLNNQPKLFDVTKQFTMSLKKMK